MPIVYLPDLLPTAAASVNTVAIGPQIDQYLSHCTFLPGLEPLHRVDDNPFPSPNPGHRPLIQQRRPPPLVSSQIQVNQEPSLPCLSTPQSPEEPHLSAS